jgi:transposase
VFVVETPRKRRVYTPEYRVEAAYLVIDTGRLSVRVAEEIGVGESLPARRVVKEHAHLGDGEPVGLSVSGRAEVDSLRQETIGLRLDNAFLGKAAVFFAARQHGENASRWSKRGRQTLQSSECAGSWRLIVVVS